MLPLHIILALVVGSQPAPSPALPLTKHESVSNLPSGWQYHKPAQDHEPVSLELAIKHPHQNYLDVAAAVSDPSSPRYGQHLDYAQFQALLPDVSAERDVIVEWLQRESMEPSVTNAGEFITFSTTVGEARRILDADFAWYSNRNGDPVMRTTQYSIPAHLREKIDFIFPTVHFMDTGKVRSIQLDQEKLGKRLPPAIVNCTNSLCPAQVKDLYNINYSPPDQKSKSSIGVAGFLEQYVLEKDVQDFLSKYGLRKDSKPFNFSIELVNGGKNPQNESTSGAEATLDLEWVAAFTDPLPITFISTGGRPPTWSQPGNKSVPASKSGNEPYLQTLNYLLAQKTPPQVLSISYTDTEQEVPKPYADKVCDLFGRLAARGVSVIVASGDGGAAGTGDSDYCIAPDGKTNRFLPTFPASCPWVTSVGAVGNYKPTEPTSYSSGGFSNYFGVPKWQKTATMAYQAKLGNRLKAYYNSSGRGIPDVAVVGNDFLTYSGGFAEQQKGTSASTPVFAAMVALLNDLRLREGKHVLGFLNPLLYSTNGSATFKDVTSGSAGGCSFKDGKYAVGFPAVKGWDAGSGLGTPDFTKLRKLVV